MPDIDIDPLDDGNAFTAASLQTNFTALQAGINSLPAYAPHPGAFKREHLPSLVPIDASLTAADYTKRESGTLGTYTNTYPGFGLDDYTAAGPGAGANVWRGLSSGLQVTFPPIQLGMSELDRVAGFLCMANVQLTHLLDAGAVGNGDSSYMAVFTWMWFDGGVWRNIDRCERAVNMHSELQWGLVDGRQRMDIPLRTFIKATDTSPGGVLTDIEGIQVAVSFHNDGGAALVGAGTVTLGRACVSAIPFHAAVN